MRVDGDAVPDITLGCPGRDLELQLADPFGPRRKPAITGDLTVLPHSEAATPAGQPCRDQVAFWTHRGRDQLRAGGVDLLNSKKRRTRRRQVRRPERALDQKGKKR